MPLLSLGAYASGGVRAQYDNGKVYVTGNFDAAKNENISIIAAKENIENFVLLNDNEKTYKTDYIKQIKTDESGSFGVSFPFGKSGEYTVSAVNANGSASDVLKIYNEFDADRIDELSTTDYAPYLKQYNFTTENQYINNYHGGEGGQKGFAMEYSPQNTDIVYFGTDTSGVWKSTDCGKNWKNSSVGIGCFGTVAIKCDIADVKTVYAAVCPNSTGNNTKVTDQTGIYVSYDGGESWTFEQNLDFYRHHSQSLFAYHRDTLYCAGHNGKIYKRVSRGNWELVCSYDGEMIYNFYIIGDKFVLATKDNGLMTSSNFGETWQKNVADFDVPSVLSAAFDPINSENVYCVTKDYLYKSTDGGKSFLQIKKSSQIQSGLKDAFGQIFFNENGRLYVQLYGISYPLRFSDDGGITFNKMAMNTSLGFMSNKTGYGCEPVAVNPQNPNEIIASMDGEIYKSLDGGKNFFASSSGFSGLRVMDIAFNPNDDNDIIFSIMDFGAVKTDNKNVGESYPLANYIALRHNSKGASRSVARNPFDQNNILINVGQSSTGFIIKESRDNGKTFSDIPATAGFNTTKIFYNKNREGVIYAKEIVSYDGGLTWQKSDFPIYAVSPVDPDIVYGVKDNKIYKSADMGRNWEYLYPVTAGFQDISPDAVKEDRLYVGFFSGGMRIYDDGGYKVVNRSDDGYDMKYIFSVAQNPNNVLHLLAGGVDNKNFAPSEGLFESRDGGESWHIVRGIPHGRDIWKIHFHPNLARAYVTTSSGTYIYEYEKFSASDIVVSDCVEKKENNVDFAIFKVYNVSNGKKDVKVISALYSEDEKALVSADIKEYSIPPLGFLEIKNEITDSDKPMRKLLFWSGFDTLMPYTKYKLY